VDALTDLVIADADQLPDHPSTAPQARALTSREREIAALIAEGLPNRQIADRLGIAKRTVDTHVEHIYSKLGISSRVQLTIRLRSAQ